MSPRPSRLTRAADAIVEAYQTGDALAHLTDDRRPRTPAEGYKVQRLVADQLGFGTCGWKIGATNSGARRMFKTLSPFASLIFTSRVVESGTTLPGGVMRVRGVESEFCLKLSSALPARATDYSLDEVQAAVGTVHAAIEVVEPRFADWIGAGISSVIADMGGNGYCIVGPGVPKPAKVDLADVLVELHVNGESKVRGAGVATEGGPAKALLWLANKLRTGPGLAAGDIVMTGSCTGLYKAAAGDLLTAKFDGFGEVSVQL